MSSQYYTYLLEANGLYKIGKTKNIKRRINQLRTASPDIKLLAYIDLDIEKELHQILYPFRYKLEWYKLNNPDEVYEYFIDKKINN